MAGKATGARGQVDSLYGQFLEAQNNNEAIANQAVALGTVTGTTGKATGAKGQIDSLYGQFLENEEEINRNANQTVNLGLSNSSVSHGSSVGGEVVPATTETEPTETEPTETGGGAPKYDTSSGPRSPLSYSSYLTSAGANVQSAYNEAVAAARREYAFNRATFGAKGEQLARAGLTGSGYGDYLEGKAYAAMASTVGQVERAKADSYANYLASYGAQAGSYSSYLSSEVDDYVNTTLTPWISQALLKNQEISDADLIAVAKQAGYDITPEHIQLARNNAIVNNRVSGADTAYIDNAAYGLVYDGDGNMLPMQDEQYYRNVAATRFGLNEEQMESYLQKVQQYYGKTFEELNAETTAKMDEENRIKAEQEAVIREGIIDSVVKSALEQSAESGFVTKEMLDLIVDQNNLDVDDGMMAEIENRLTKQDRRVTTNAQMTEYMANASVNEVNNVSELVNTYSKDAVAKLIGQGGDETKINVYREAASERIAELFLSAFDFKGTEDEVATQIAKMLYGSGATADMLGSDQGGAILEAAYDAFDAGAMSYEDVESVFDAFVERDLNTLGETDGTNGDKAVDLAQTFNKIADTLGKDSSAEGITLYRKYRDMCLEKINKTSVAVNLGSTANIFMGVDGSMTTISVITERPIRMLPAGEQGEMTYYDGGLYICKEDDLWVKIKSVPDAKKQGVYELLVCKVKADSKAS